MPKLAGINHQKAVKAFKKTGFWVVGQGHTKEKAVANLKEAIGSIQEVRRRTRIFILLLCQ